MTRCWYCTTLAPSLVLKTVDALAEGNVSPLAQDLLAINPEKLHAPKIFKENCRIDWAKPGIVINNLIRGLSPYPAAWTNLRSDGSEFGVKIFKAAFEQAVHQCNPGEIVSDNKKYLKIAATDGFLNILDLQLAGKKRMGIEEFLRGFPKVINYTTR